MLSYVSIPFVSENSLIVDVFKDPVDLSKKMIGLKEVVFKKSWKTFSKDQLVGLYEINKENERIDLASKDIPNRRYESPKELLEVINKTLNEIAHHIGVNCPQLFLVSKERVTVAPGLNKSTSSKYYPYFSPELLAVLGLSKRYNELFEDDDIEAIREIDLDVLKKIFFVTCHLIKTYTNGMDDKQILKCLKRYAVRENDFLQFTIDDIQWFEIKEGDHKAIAISITDQNFNPIAFTYGMVSVTIAIKDKESMQKRKSSHFVIKRSNSLEKIGNLN